MTSFVDLCRFVPTLGGTTDWVYSSAVVGCQSPAAANVQAGSTYTVYAASNDLSQWEISKGANSGVTTFPRTTVLYNSSGTGTAAGQTGAGTKINFSTVPQVSVVMLAEDASNFSTAAAMFTPANPAAGSASATGLMMGFGSTCVLTPTRATRVRAIFSVVAQNTVAGSGAGVTIYYGTGAAPANGAALTGTAVGARQFGQSITAGANVPFTQYVNITGLTPGTQIWCDIAVTNGGSGTSTITNVTCTIEEF